MKNKLSISLIAVALSCAFAFVAYATGTENDEINGSEDIVGMELSANEVQSIKEECKEIGVEDGVEGDELITFVEECFAANTMAFDEANPEESELATEDQEIPAMEDETLSDSEEPNLVDEEPLTESTS